jgi:hypothetical protein
VYFHSSQCRLIPYLHQRPIFFQNKLIYCRHFRTYSRYAMFDWSDTVFRRRIVTRRRISNTVLQPRYWGREVDSPEVCRLVLSRVSPFLLTSTMSNFCYKSGIKIRIWSINSGYYIILIHIIYIHSKLIHIVDQFKDTILLNVKHFQIPSTIFA